MYASRLSGWVKKSAGMSPMIVRTQGGTTAVVNGAEILPMYGGVKFASSIVVELPHSEHVYVSSDTGRPVKL